MKSTYSKYSNIFSSRGITAEQAARKVLDYYNVQGVEFNRVRGSLTDFYDPRSNSISLSDAVYGQCSVAAIGVACHEAGHAAQHAQGYLPIKIRNAIIPVCNIGSYLGLPIAFLGFFLNIYEIVLVGFLMYALIAVFQIVTLPVELDASRRAMKVIAETDILYGDEQKGARKVLTAAAMTYVAALASVILNILRFAMILGVGRRRDD